MDRLFKILNLLLTVFYVLLFMPSSLLSQKACLFFPGMASVDSLIHDQPANEGVTNALAKAQMVAGVEWNPIETVPSVYATSYESSGNYLGVPYSLAQKVNGLVGLDVSLYTFLTALHNPRSVMYTEDLSGPPYNGFDTAPYYGSVCATSVWYVLGIKAPYYTSSINAMNELRRRDDLPADSIQLCDVLWKTGHVAMVYDIARDNNDSIQKVIIFETTTSLRRDSKLVEYTFEGFKDRWNSGGYMIYRPKNLTNNPSPDDLFIWTNGHLTPKFDYNEDLCTSHGDRVAYPVGDSVVVNVLSNNYDILELYKEEVIFERVELSSENRDVVFYDLPYGSYKARLVNEDSTMSEFTFFEVIDIDVSYVLGERLTVFFASANGVPEFMSLGDIRECPYYCTVFTASQINQGFATVAHSADYLKVHFRGQYGRVSNRKIKIE